MKKRLWALFLAAVMGLTFIACSDEDPTAEVTVVEETGDASADAAAVEEEPEETSDAVSLLTGLEISQDYAGRRPVAVMIPNDNYGALPHVGIGEAGIIYEILVEGSYTRLMAVFDAEAYENLEKIGPVRSCREYYCYYALDYDAIYVHYGQASTAVSFLNSGAIDHLNGMTDSGFFRDSSRSNPNNAFTSGEELISAISSKGFDTAYSDDYTGTFVFADEVQTLSDGIDADIVTPYYPIDNPWFEYNEEDGLYYHYEYGEAHTDSLTGEQLSFTNILILSVPTTQTNDSKNHLSVTVTGTGEGYYVSNGKAVEITWQKDSETSATRYYDADGNELVMNTGKTFVCIQSNDAFSKVSFEGYTSESDEADASETTAE